MNTHPPEERIEAWCEGLLASEEARELEEHCRTCARCAEIRREAEAVLRALALDAAQRPAPPQPLWPDLHVQLTRPRTRWAMVIAASAAALVGLIIGYTVGTWAPAEDRTTTSAQVLIPSSTGLSEFYFEGMSSGQADHQEGERQ